MNKRDIKVSVLCITYNQQDYIAQSLDGIFMQKTSFKFEVLVHDDASTDNTQKIIKSYEQKYPGVIRPVYEIENQFSINDKTFLKNMFTDARGDYIAICEGDDFWTDPLKLQKQVDYLDAHRECNIIFHPVRIFFENHEQEDVIFPDISNQRYFTFKKLLRENFIQTNSVMYRNQGYNYLVPEVMPFDWYLHLTHAINGKIGFMNEVMSVYRRHDGGIWWDTTGEGRDEIWKRHSTAHVLLYAELLELLGDTKEYQQIIDEHIEGTINILSRIDSAAGTHLISKFVKEHPERCGLLLQSLSRTTYKNYKNAEEDTAAGKRIIEEAHRKIEILEQENEAILTSRQAILNSKTYRLGNRIASVSRIVRRNHEK